MNGSIAKYFKSPKVAEGEKEKDEKESKVEEGDPAEEQAGPSKVAAAPSKSDVDRMIAENMASVLKSLKKKRSHKCSKRRRNEERKEGQHPDDEEVVEIVEEKDPAPRRSPRKAHKQDEADQVEAKEQTKQEQGGKKLNAFQLMMSSRNKAIGSNSPGKDDSAGEGLNPEEEKKREDKVKRKLKLEEWADRKGAGKRKMQEEAEEEYIAHQMNRRAKRFKKLIRNMELPEDDDEENVVEQKKSPRKSVKPKKEPSPKKADLKLNEKRGRRR